MPILTFFQVTILWLELMALHFFLSAKEATMSLPTVHFVALVNVSCSERPVRSSFSEACAILQAFCWRQQH